MSECNHDCGNCSANCGERTAPQSFLIEPNAHSSIKKVIGIVSGKGGVGKSSVTSLLACEMNRLGYRVGIIDADITGPSIPNMFNLHTRAYGTEDGILPVQTATGIEVMSMNLLLEREVESVIYRGPVIANIVKQFYSDVIWEDIDYLFVDMPPGTGDVPLTVFQSYPLDGIIIVSTPQQLVSMIVSKACNMAEKMNVPVLGIVENMSYVRCPDCGKRLDLFKDSHVEDVASEYGLSVLAKMPLMSEVMEAADKGEIEKVEVNYLSDAVRELEALLEYHEEKEIIAIPVEADGATINAHFGHTEYFRVYTISNNELATVKLVPNSAEHHKIATFLKSIGVDTIIAGSVGEGNLEDIEGCAMNLYRGVSGNADAALRAYVLGDLVDDVTCVCDHSDDSCCCGGHDSGCGCGTDDEGGCGGCCGCH
ncbi:MAG: P-loop NTPase [Erysipelotrichales bacterium]|nr:P-loop NTPase [Erysipelotrichales bacterium]